MKPASMGAAIAHASSADTHENSQDLASEPEKFDAAAWLTTYERAGGAYALCDDRLCMFIVPGNRAEGELTAARRMIAGLDEPRKAALVSSLRNTAHSEPTRDWDGLVARWREIRRLEETHPAISVKLDDPRRDEVDDDYRATYRRAQEALKAILATPAPTISAVGDKLAMLVEDEPDNPDLAVLKVIEADCRRLSWQGNDTTITEAFRLWQNTHRERSALLDGSDLDQREEPFWKIIDAAEETIRSTLAVTPAGIAAKLWVALEHDVALQADMRVAREGELAAMLDDREQDWSVRLILSALRSLNALAPPALPADDPVVRYWKAFHAHEADQISDDDYMAAFEEMWDWEPTTPRDFIRKFEAAYSLGGCPTEENQDRLVKQAVAILGGANSSQEAA